MAIEDILIRLLLFYKVIRFSRLEYVLMHAYSPRALSSRKPELPVYAVLAPHKHKVLCS
jgi:hypothetical protein